MSHAGRPWRLAFPMYNVTPGLALAWKSLLHKVVDGLRSRGWDDPMQVVAPPSDLMAFWRAPDLLLSQTCGYPLATALQSDVRVLAAPAFGLPGCAGMTYCSVILVPENGVQSLDALRGSVAAINQDHSQSGMNALRHTIAPLARGGRFFSQVLVSGSHMASIGMLQRGQAAVAAIDCVTYGLAVRHAPQALAGVRKLQYTVSAPGLPLIASRQLTDAQAQDLQEVLLSLTDTAAPELQALSVDRFHAIGLTAYAPLLEQARFAAAHAYPELV